jgi:23S rRNA (cytidine1920-2'-O)/16S rRNA (cytidine1409-2'-O)-methyltransferase
LARVRLDQLLTQRSLAPSRQRAQGMIMAGIVYVNGQQVIKPGSKFPPEVEIEVKGQVLPYVSRGGLKLKKALDLWQVDVTDKVVIDVGASTGGFTDCLLQHGARKVYAVDVGYGQLAWSLRTDPRVVVMERTNIRHMNPGDLEEPPDLATVDVSFISIRKFLEVLWNLLTPAGEVIALVKPQFEAGREQVGKKGVVRDPEVHRHVLLEIAQAALSWGWKTVGLTYSPITGPEGNIEFLIYWRKQTAETVLLEDEVGRVVADAHRWLRG